MKTFKQAMIVPTMVTLGCGALLLAQNLSLVEVSYAAPAAQTDGAVPADKPGRASAAPKSAPGGAQAPATGGEPAVSGAEFGSDGESVPGTIKAVSDDELNHKAIEASGREDPFMALLPPDPSAIVPPPVTFAPIKPLQPVGSLPTIPAVPKATPKKPEATPVPDLPWAGSKAPAPQEPQWLVRGVMSTGTDRMALLEGKDENIHARIGDVLSDGSKVEAISNSGVTFMRGGRRFVKAIGGSY